MRPGTPLGVKLKRVASNIGFTLAVFVIVSPAILVMLWMLSLSLKNEVDNLAFPPVFIPNPPTLANFLDVFDKNSFDLYFMNSLIVSGVSTLVAILVGVPAGYGIAKAQAHKIAVLTLIARITPGLSYRLASRLGTTPPAAGENHDTRFEFNWLREIRHPAIESPGYV